MLRSEQGRGFHSGRCYAGAGGGAWGPSQRRRTDIAVAGSGGGSCRGRRVFLTPRSPRQFTHPTLLGSLPLLSAPPPRPPPTPTPVSAGEWCGPPPADRPGIPAQAPGLAPAPLPSPPRAPRRRRRRLLRAGPGQPLPPLPPPGSAAAAAEHHGRRREPSAAAACPVCRLAVPAASGVEVPCRVGAGAGARAQGCQGRPRGSRAGTLRAGPRPGLRGGASG